MNIENIKKTIAIMERARDRDSLDMDKWQTACDYQGSRRKVWTEPAFHECGNKACLAGHIAISPEWKADGGLICPDGSPMTADQFITAICLGDWWGIDHELASDLIYYRPVLCMKTGRVVHTVYGKVWAAIKPEDVIRVLTELIEIGEDAFIDKYTGAVERIYRRRNADAASQ